MTDEEIVIAAEAEVAKTKTKKKNVWAKTDKIPKKRYKLNDKIKLEGYTATSTTIKDIIAIDIQHLNELVHKGKYVMHDEVKDYLRDEYDFYIGHQMPQTISCRKETSNAKKAKEC